MAGVGGPGGGQWARPVRGRFSKDRRAHQRIRQAPGQTDSALVPCGKPTFFVTQLGKRLSDDLLEKL